MRPNIKLVGISDSRESAWKFSRPTFNNPESELNDAFRMDMAFNSLCMFTFEIKSSVIFRDFLFSLRPHYAWAMSSRDVPLTLENTHVSEEFKNHGIIAIRAAIIELEKGVHQNQARRLLPMTLSTQYTISIDFRSLCGLIKTIEELDEDLFLIYGTQFASFAEVVTGFNHNEIKSFANSYLLSDFEQDNNRIKMLGEIAMGSCKLKSAMMSQFLRQSRATVKTELWNLIKDIGYLNLGYLTQDSEIQTAFYIPKEAYYKLMQVRSHWFADWSTNMWGQLIDDFTCTMTDEEFWNFIPSGAGKPDPFHYHTLKRVDGDDLNSPCPIALEHPQLILDRLDAEGQNYVVQRYIGLANRGYIKDNHTNELRIRYANRNK